MDKGQRIVTESGGESIIRKKENGDTGEQVWEYAVLKNIWIR